MDGLVKKKKKKEYFLTVLDAKNVKLGVSMVKFWWDLSMTLQIADLSLYHHVAEKQKASYLVL